MPNWCQNDLYIEADEATIAEIKAAILQGDENEQGLLNYLRPQPELEETGGRLPAWYVWRTDNWGVKWEVDPVITGETETSLYLNFQSAWGPPIEAIRHWMEQDNNRKVDLRYIEWGMAFCGIFNNEEDSYFEIPATTNEVERLIPVELDEQFDIYGMVESWEREEEGV